MSHSIAVSGGVCAERCMAVAAARSCPSANAVSASAAPSVLKCVPPSCSAVAIQVSAEAG